MVGWSEGVAAFAFDPLSTSFKLEFAFGVVVVECIAGDVLQGVFFGHIAGFFTDDNGEFDFPVRLF